MGSQEVQSPVVWVDIPVVNLDRAIAFYSGVLGTTVQKQEAPGFSMGVLPHGGTGVGGCLAVMKDIAPSDHGPLIYINCDGKLDAAIVKAAELGGRVVEPRQAIGTHGFRALVIDSEGNRIALHSMT